MIESAPRRAGMIDRLARATRETCYREKGLAEESVRLAGHVLAENNE